MKIEIDEGYIQWLRETVFKALDLTEEEITEYVNDVLRLHRESWEDCEAPEPRRLR